jgi:hypothetical protein
MFSHDAAGCGWLLWQQRQQPGKRSAPIIVGYDFLDYPPLENTGSTLRLVQFKFRYCGFFSRGSAVIKGEQSAGS